MRNVFALLFVIASFYFVSCTMLSGQGHPLPDAASLLQNNAETPYRHDFVTSEYSKKMRDYFIKTAKKEAHVFTKFNRQELIDILSQSSMDTVKFVIGAFFEDGPVNKKKGKPVIMLQVEENVQNTREQPGGHMAGFKYLQGGICPPPDGSCTLEQ